MARTRWWYLLVGIGVLNAVWGLAGVLSGATIAVGPAALWLALAAAVLAGTPVFYYALYRELGRIRASGSAWAPDRRWWLGGGVLLAVAGSSAFFNPLTHYVAALFLVQQVRQPAYSDPADRAS